MNSVTQKPVIGITIGDPSGIGPEIIIKALQDCDLRSMAHYVIFGLGELMAYTADQVESNVFWSRIQHEDICTEFGNNVVLADYDEIDFQLKRRREPRKVSGAASFKFVEDAIEFARSGVIDAIVTAPICKESWRMAGVKNFPGHTELLADRCYAKRYAMMFAGGPFRVTLATIHEGLFSLRHTLNIGKVFDPIDLTHQALQRYFGIPRPRIAVAGLNPHAGENGMFGDEEHRVIEPAIVMAKEHGINVEGPFPADTLFHSALDGRYDAIIAMYHDQGLIPVKMVAFDKAVNVTLGLDIIRTSPDHGVAFDIAGKNIARPDSMKEAIKLACHMAKCKAAEK